MQKLLPAVSAILAAAVWLVLYVIIGTGLGTAFIAAGVALGAAVIALGLSAVADAPVTTAGLVAGIATFVVLSVVLSVATWIDVVAGLGAVVLFDTLKSASWTRAESQSDAPRQMPGYRPSVMHRHNGHDRQTVGAR